MKTGMGGSIITVASMSSHITNRPQPHAPYNATKAAVLQLTKSTACEWAPHNIRVSTISPGYFDTAMNRKILAEQGEEGVKMRKFWEAQTPMGRLGTPHELKGVVVFLASSASTFVTGAEFLVDGGYTAWWTNHDPSCHPNLILLRPSTYTREFCTASSVPFPFLSFPFLDDFAHFLPFSIRSFRNLAFFSIHSFFFLFAYVTCSSCLHSSLISVQSVAQCICIDNW